MTVRLEKPTLKLLPGYVEALERGWGPDNLRPEASGREQLEKIAKNPAAFVASLDDSAWRADHAT